MVRRRSTVRFRNGAPAHRNNSNLSNIYWEPFREPIGPDPSHDTAQPQRATRSISPPPVCGAMRSGRLFHEPARLRGGSSAWRAGWTGTPGALGRSGRVSRRAAADRYGLTVRLVVMSQQVSTLASAYGAGSNSEFRMSASPRSLASMMAQEWWATSRHSRASACWASAGTGRRRAGAGRWWRGWGRSRCRAARRRLQQVGVRAQDGR